MTWFARPRPAARLPARPPAPPVARPAARPATRPAARRGARPRWRLAAAVLAAVAVFPATAGALAGCSGQGSRTVTVLGPWTGGEAAAFRRVLAAFERRSGIHVAYSGGREVPAALAQAIERGTPPDVAVVSDPVTLRSYVARHKLQSLQGVLDTAQVDAQYPASWRQLMRAGSTRYYAVVVKASLKSLIWYDPQVFRARGYTPPQSWDDLAALTRTAVRAGTPAWCLGLESTSASGWPGTDWIEDILLHQSGPAVYQRWIDGTLPWTSPEVRQAWQRWGLVVGTAGAVDGGARSALVTNFAGAGTGMFAARPTCLMDHAASFITASYSAARTASGGAPQPGTDFDLVPFPRIDERYAGALEVGADMAGLFTDTPAARQLIAFLATAQAQQIWPAVPGGGALSVNAAVPLSVYGDPVAGAMARLVTGRGPGTSGGASARPVTSLSFDASDLMPGAVRTAFYQAVLQYVADPGQLDTILSRLDRVRRHAGG